MFDMSVLCIQRFTVKYFYLRLLSYTEINTELRSEYLARQGTRKLQSPVPFLSQSSIFASMTQSTLNPDAKMHGHTTSVCAHVEALF